MRIVNFIMVVGQLVIEGGIPRQFEKFEEFEKFEKFEEFEEFESWVNFISCRYI
jgi:hypothetical protein